jgi:hypothetical protein
MVPPIPTDQDQGRLIDGKRRSAQWRDKDAARKAADSKDKHADDSAMAARDLYKPPTGLRQSVMIPADQLPLDPPAAAPPIQKHANGNGSSDGAGDPCIANLITQAATTPEPANDPPTEPNSIDDNPTATDRFFEQQALAPPNAVTRQTVGLGTASLTVADTPARRRLKRLRIHAPRPTSTPVRRNHAHASAERTSRSMTLTSRRLVLASAIALAVLAGAVVLTNGSGARSQPRHQADVAAASTIPAPLGAYVSHATAVLNRAVADLARNHIIARRHHPRARPHRNTHRRHVREARPHPSSRTSQAPATSPTAGSAGASGMNSTGASSSQASAAPAASSYQPGGTSAVASTRGVSHQPSSGASSAPTSPKSSTVTPTGSSGVLGPIGSPNG